MRRLLLVVAVVLAGVAACADDGVRSGGSSGADGSLAPGGSTGAGADGVTIVAPGATMHTSTTPRTTPRTTPPAGTTTHTTTHIATTTTTGAADATDPPDQPPPPVPGCVDAAGGPAVVEVSFDDDTLRYAGAVAPPCVRIHGAQRLQLTNAASFPSPVSIGATALTLHTGEHTTTAVLGTVHAVGDVFDVHVDALDAPGATLVVQVLH